MDKVQITILIILIVFSILKWIATQISSAIKNLSQQPPPGQPPNSAREQLNDEVRKFVQNVKNRSASTSGPPNAPQPPRKNRPAGNTPSTALNPPQKKPRKKKTEPEVVTAQVVELTRRRLRPGLDEQVSTAEYESRVKSMSHVDQEAVAIDSHVHQVFDHQLGKLDHDPTPMSEQRTEGPATPVSLGEITAGMLADPLSVRQAIIMYEILARPEHRW